MSERFRTKLAIRSIASAILLAQLLVATSAYAYSTPAVAQGFRFSLGLRPDGTAVAVGDNGANQCDVSSWTDIVKIAAGDSYSLGLKADGSVVATGSNYSNVCDVSGWHNVTALATGSDHTIGLKNDGTVECTYPADQIGPYPPLSWTDITAVASGGSFVAGLKSNGTAVMTTGFYAASDTPLWSDIKSISAGSYHLVGLKNDGTVIATGEPGLPELEVASWSDIATVTAGYRATVGIHKNGTVVVAGTTGYGDPLGDVSQWRNIVAVAPGFYYILGLRSDGTVLCSKETLPYLSVSGWYLPSAPQSLSGAFIDGLSSSYLYTAQPITPTPRLMLGAYILSQERDYTVAYHNNVAPGSATITFTGIHSFTGTLAKTFSVLFRLNISSKTVPVKGTTQLILTGGTGPITWKSSNPAVASVSSTGLVRTLSAGAASISATRNGLSRTCRVTVVKRPYTLALSKITISGTGYVSVVAKTWTGAAAAYRSVRFYRSGSYLGSAKTNRYGKARVRVARNRSPRTFKATVTGDAIHATTSVVRSLAF